jgi:3-hydroxypropanoate dehydrogenase
MKFGPTSANCCPLRIVFVTTPEGKAKLKPCLAEGNVEKTMSAPVTALFAQDNEFYEHFSYLFPVADAKAWFTGSPGLIEETATRNASLQAAYFMIIARAYGLDCGPMSGFDKDALNEAFFKGTTHTVNFICNLGYGDASKLYPRLPRFDFEQVCSFP